MSVVANLPANINSRATVSNGSSGGPLPSGLDVDDGGADPVFAAVLVAVAVGAAGVPAFVEPDACDPVPVVPVFRATHLS